MTDRTEAQIAASKHVAAGWRIVTDNGDTILLAKGKHVNHILHLLLSVFTAGIWLPVWLLVAIKGGENTKTITTGRTGGAVSSSRLKGLDTIRRLR